MLCVRKNSGLSLQGLKPLDSRPIIVESKSLRYRRRVDYMYNTIFSRRDFKGLHRKRIERALSQAGLKLDKHTLDSLHYYDFSYLLTLCDALEPRLALYDLHEKIDGKATELEDYYQVVAKMVTWLSQNQKYIPVVCAFLEFMRHKFARAYIVAWPKTDYQISKEITEFKKAILAHKWNDAKEIGLQYIGWWN
ncbi:hypothetical protein [Ligilactobacillus equi]|uniref:Peptide ABC transporter n=1 Tax=Ligilactobacillus equi DPC 6820 TaxID=1392007 RepID=V7HX33_9LACO|nr:hypothetical protein [Ligilactobacillus equi]ETA73773.1 peptide ABC transporter [Ligilactobacillus equi DPC 6820]